MVSIDRLKEYNRIKDGTNIQDLDKKIKVSFFLDWVSLVQFIDLQPSLKARKIVAEIKDVRQIDYFFTGHDVYSF